MRGQARKRDALVERVHRVDTHKGMQQRQAQHDSENEKAGEKGALKCGAIHGRVAGVAELTQAEPIAGGQ